MKPNYGEALTYLLAACGAWQVRTWLLAWLRPRRYRIIWKNSSEINGPYAGQIFNGMAAYAFRRREDADHWRARVEMEADICGRLDVEEVVKIEVDEELDTV